MATDLFAAAAEERLRRSAPLADRLRPTSLDEVVGHRDLLGPGGTLRALVESDRLSSAILWGPPGTGKTTVARLAAAASSKEFVQLSAVTATVKDVRGVIAAAEARLGERDRGTILFLDEVHRFNKAQQDALLPAVETGLVVLVGATTENPYFEVNPPLLSRSVLFRLQPLAPDELGELLRRGLEAEGVEADDDALEHLAGRADGDGRHVLTALEVAAALATARARASEDRPPTAARPEGAGPRASEDRPRIVLADAEAALGAKAVVYGRDDHYDVVSAFIKSIRGSDIDAGLYWLAHMLRAGEDPRFIARRLVILASEDVGMADPMAIVVADAAARAVEFVGLPEAQLNLAQAVVHLAAAPKSNRVTTALGAAMRDVREVPTSGVPRHLRDGHYQGAAKLGHGTGYAYPHDDPAGWVDQQYRPPEVAGNRYYEASGHGYEARVAERQARLRGDVAPADEPGSPDAAGPAGATGPADPADTDVAEEAGATSAGDAEATVDVARETS